MTRPRCADDFATIRARVAELRNQRAQSMEHEDAGPVPDSRSLYRDSGRSALVQRPGIPGWRVARIKRQLFKT